MACFRCSSEDDGTNASSKYPVITANKPSRDLWTTPQPSYARLPHIEPRSSSASPSVQRPSRLSRQASADPSSNRTMNKGKGKGRDTSSAHQQQHRQSKSPELPHVGETIPSGFGTANEDYNTLTEEYIEAAQETGYDGKVKNIENEGPLVEGSKAWEEVRHREEEENASSSTTPSYMPFDGSDGFRNVWGGTDHARPEGRHL